MGLNEENGGYRFSGAERKALDNIEQEMKQLQAAKTGMLRLILEQQGLQGEYQLAPDGSGFVKKPASGQ